MDTVSNWLSDHGFCAEDVQSILLDATLGRIENRPSELATNYEHEPPENVGTISDALSRFILPAFSRNFPPGLLIEDQLSQIRFRPLITDDVPPHFRKSFDKSTDVISMNWAGRPRDLVCLAHECAHALQAQFSNGLMPPVAREVCAFLGEVWLIRYVMEVEPRLGSALLAEWDEDSKIYLLEHLVELEHALVNATAPYQYSFNYPIARLLAVAIDGSDQRDFLKLFSSGASVMEHMPALKPVRDPAARPLIDVLPALPDESKGIAEGYQILGALVAIDLQADRDGAELSIEAYYKQAMTWLSAQSISPVLDAARRPIGYGTWDWTKDGSFQHLRIVALAGHYSSVRNEVHRRLEAVTCKPHAMKGQAA